MSTNTELEKLSWEKFERSFNIMFIPEMTKNAVGLQLLDLQQGDMPVAEYETKFKEL